MKSSIASQPVKPGKVTKVNSEKSCPTLIAELWHKSSTSFVVHIPLLPHSKVLRHGFSDEQAYRICSRSELAAQRNSSRYISNGDGFRCRSYVAYCSLGSDFCDDGDGEDDSVDARRDTPELSSVSVAG